MMLCLRGRWLVDTRICKECRLAYGDVKAKMPLAVFDRIFVQVSAPATVRTVWLPDQHPPHNDRLQT